MPTIREQADSTLKDLCAAYTRRHYDAAATLTRQCRKYAHIQERWCSEEMSEQTTEALEQTELRLEERITANARDLGAKRVEFQGDPRGFTVKLHFGEDHGGNTWGGDGLIGVHGS